MEGGSKDKESTSSKLKNIDITSRTGLSKFDYYRLKHKPHKTSDPEAQQDWAHRRFLLFPSLLPDLYTPTRESFDESYIRDPANLITQLCARMGHRAYFFLSLLLCCMLALLAISFGASPTLFGATTIALSAITWYAAYETKYAQWTKGLEPNWRQENSKILSNWYNDYTSWLKDQGFSKHIQNATLYAVCSYSTENSKSMGQRNCESISVTDLGVKSSTSTFEELERRNPDEYLLSIQTHLEDALEQLTDEEYTIYAEFNSIGEQKKTSLMSGLPSTKRYLKELRESLFSRTMFLSDLETRSRWEQLLAIPDFLERQIITNSTTDQQMALHSFIENIIDSEEPTCHLIKANSGHGKTTLMTQLVIHLIETNSDTDVHPLLIKARNIDQIGVDGNLPHLNNQESQPYVESWKASRKKILVIDGIDENLRLSGMLRDRLSSTARAYNTHIIATGRENTELPHTFTEVRLANFTEDYVDKLIWNSSGNPEIRTRISRYIPTALKQHPLVIFGSSEMMTDKDETFEKSDISYDALARLIFRRDLEAGKRKHESEKFPYTNAEFAREIGLFAGHKILGKEVSMTDPVKTAFRWELISVDGVVNESLLEGFFLVSAIDSTNIDSFVQLWDELYLDLRRWSRFISAYLTSKNTALPPLSEYFNEDDELDDYVDLINIAADEWMRGNLETRKEIVRKLGLASDEKGRLVIQDVQEIPHEFRQQGMITTLMNFHCSSWVHDIDEWESSSDPTWQTLACQILNQMPDLVEDASREYDHILRKCLYNTPMMIKDKLPLHNEIIRIYEPKHQHAGPLERVKNYIATLVYGGSNISAYMHEQRTRTRDKCRFFTETIRNAWLIPHRWELPKQERGFTEFFGPVSLLISTKLTEIQNTRSVEEQTKIAKSMLFFIESINYSSRAEMFSFPSNNSDLFILFQNTLEKVSCEKTQNIIKFLYTILRGGTNASVDNVLAVVHDTSYEIENSEFQMKKRVPFKDAMSPVLNGHEFRLTQLGQVEQSSLVFQERTRYNSYWPHTSLNPQNSELEYFWVEKRGHTGIIHRNDHDGVQTQCKLFEKRIYSVLPNALTPTSSYVLVHQNRNLTTSKQFEWGYAPWFSKIPHRLKDILYNKSIREQYDKIDQAQTMLKAIGSVSDQLSAEHEFNQFEIDDDMRFIGICDARRGPNTKSNHYHLHILTGTTENDVYITNQSSGDCWNFINDRFQKYMNNAVIYIEFKVVVEQLQNNKHCVIVPTDVVEICRSCFRTDVNFSGKYASFCTSCQDKMFSSGVNGYLRHISAAFPFLLLEENEKTVKIKLQKRNSGRLGEIIAALEEIRDLYEIPPLEWKILEPTCMVCQKNYMESTLHQAGRNIICEECSQVNWEGLKSRFQNAPGMAPWEKTYLIRFFDQWLEDGVKRETSEIRQYDQNIYVFADNNHWAPKPLSKMFKPNPRRLMFDSEHGGKIETQDSERRLFSILSRCVCCNEKNIEDCMILPPLSEEDHKAIFMSFKFNKGKEPIKRETPSYYVCAACRGEEKIPVFVQGTLPDIDDPNFNEEYPHGAWIGDSFKSILMEAFQESSPLLRYVEYGYQRGHLQITLFAISDNPTIKNHINLRTIKFRELTGENPYFQLKPANKAQLARKRKQFDDNLKKLQLKEMSSEYDYDEWGDNEFERSRKRRRR